MLVVAGFDVGRYHRSGPVAPWLQIAALVLVFLEYSYVIRLHGSYTVSCRRPRARLVAGTLIAGVPMILLCRTLLEDKMLREELAGYEEYAAQVKYRLALGVW